MHSHDLFPMVREVIFCKKKSKLFLIDLNTQIKDFIESQPELKRRDVEMLHAEIQKLMPDAKLWFFDGRDENGKIVANPQIGYGSQMIKYADGKEKEFYQIGLSTNSTGISVYIMGLKDKKYLPGTYSGTIGKASVTGYCIKFKKLQDINSEILMEAIQDGVKGTDPK